MPWDKEKKGRTDWLLYEPTLAIWLETKKIKLYIYSVKKNKSNSSSLCALSLTCEEKKNHYLLTFSNTL